MISYCPLKVKYSKSSSPRDNKRKLLRFVGRTHANIIFTLSRPIRVSESYFIQILSFPKQSSTRQAKRVIGQQAILLSFILSYFFVEMEIDVLLKRAR
jgi:hypothetical protein